MMNLTDSGNGGGYFDQFKSLLETVGAWDVAKTAAKAGTVRNEEPISPNLPAGGLGTVATDYLGSWDSDRITKTAIGVAVVGVVALVVYKVAKKVL